MMNKKINFTRIDNYSQKYKLDEAKARVHHCMRGGKDEKHLNKAINEYNLMAEKGGEK